MILTDLNHNIRRTHGFERLSIEGKIPLELRGTLYRVGPGLIERFGHAVHPFLADGLITAVELDNEARGACELVKSEKFLEEEHCGHAIYDLNAHFLRRFYNGLTRQVKETGNTHVLSWQNKLFALMEQGKPVEFDADNLRTLGSSDLGIIKGSFSAHPHRVASLKTTFNFGVRGKWIDIYVLPDTGKIQLLCSFKAPWAGLIHDFTVTEKHAVFFIDPAKLVAWRAMLGLKDFSKYFYWDEAGSTRVIIVPLNDPENHCQFDVDPFRVWHFANAFESGGEIIIDAFRHENIDVITNPTLPTSDIPIPKLFRFRLNPKIHSFSGELMCDVPSEFPSVNPQVAGMPHRFIWMQTFSDENGNEGFAQLDSQSHQQHRYFAPDNHLVSEPVFVPNGSREDSGWVLQLTQDTSIGKSYLAVFDTQRIDDGPVAKLWFDQGIPATFHGVFVSKPA